MAKHPLSSPSSKHIDVRYRFLNELVGKADLSVKYPRTEIIVWTSSRRLLTERVLMNTAIYV